MDTKPGNDKIDCECCLEWVMGSEFIALVHTSNTNDNEAIRFSNSVNVSPVDAKTLYYISNKVTYLFNLVSDWIEFMYEPCETKSVQLSPLNPI